MQFERLKKSHKKEIIIGTLAVCLVGGTLTFATTRAKYKVAQDIKLVNGTINYKPYDFKTMAMYQQNDSGTYTEINEMPSSGYVVNEDKTYCTTDNKTEVKGKIKTIDGNHIISNLTKSDKCYLYFDKYVPPITIPDIIAGLNPKITIPDFGKLATTDEGVYRVSDGMYGGTSYYWRGAVTNNYVRFADKCWRIVRINGDGSIRIIYDGTTCHVNGTNTTESIAVASIAYSTTSNSSYVGWTYTLNKQRPTNIASGTASNAKIQLESWYSTNITGTNATKVADGKYCNDRNVQSGDTWSATGSTFHYAAYARMLTFNTPTPTLSCPSGDIYILNVGLITADEIAYAGGKFGSDYINSSYYLYNGQTYWSMSPTNWYSTDKSANVFVVNANGYLGGSFVNKTYGLRPVINLRSDVTFAPGGTGTLDNPYVVP